LDDLEQGLEFLEKQHRQLRGHVTGSLRSKKQREEAASEAIEAEPVAQHPPSDLAIRRRSQRGF
jgi:hypothetical protein